MILADSSAWIEYLRDTGSAACERIDDRLRLAEPDLAVCGAVRMEVLAGARSDAHRRELRRMLDRCVDLPTNPEHFESAADLYRSCRQGGETVRRLIDCLIAAIAIGAQVPVLHHDRDFQVLARFTRLEVAPATA